MIQGVSIQKRLRLSASITDEDVKGARQARKRRYCSFGIVGGLPVLANIPLTDTFIERVPGGTSVDTWIDTLSLSHSATLDFGTISFLAWLKRLAP